MTRPRPTLVVMLLVALAVALPASSALAQSAGDNQYQDPLGGNSASQGTTKPSTPSRPAQSGSASPAPAAPAQAPKATRSVPLARTGFDAWIPGAAGLVLLVGGVALLRTRRATS